jgi:hypothetical protein
MLKLTVTSTVCAVILGGGLWLGVQAEDPPKPAGKTPQPAAEKPRESKEKSHSKLMRKKLAAAQDVLEGLTTDDYAMIERGAQVLKSLAKEAEFRISENSMYTQHVTEFQSLAEKLEKAAKANNLDKASLHYVNLTMNCIECHRYVRDVLIAGKK